MEGSDGASGVLSVGVCDGLLVGVVLMNLYMGVQGHRVYLLDPKPADFQPMRTAFSLSHEHRYAGSYGPYSVAQHSVLVAETVARMGGTTLQQLAALHHDASEQVTGDIPAPVKKLCDGLRELEHHLNECVNARYGIDVHDPLVKAADSLVFAAEVRWLVPEEFQAMYMTPEMMRREPALQPGPEEFIFWTPDEAKKTFIALHEELVSKL